MLRHRIVLLVLAVSLVVGSLWGTIGYGLHLRSGAYRRAAQDDLSAVLNMPVEIGRITPLSFCSSQFHDIRTWLPRQRLQVFACERAVWREIRRGSGTDHALEIHNGWLLVGTGGWSRADYDSILRSGLGHDFAALRLTEVHLDDIDFRWDHVDFHLSAKDAAGVILFDGDGRGRAALDSRRLNDYATTEPIHIHAQFFPGAGLRFDEVVLEVPRIPLNALGLERLLGGAVSAGTFAGRIVYREGEQQQRLNVSGYVADGALEELTRRVIGGPFSGVVSVALDEASFVGRRLQSLSFRGRLDGVRIGDVIPMLNAPELQGRLSLDVGQFKYEDGHVTRFSGSGQADDLSLDAVTRALGYGEITGQLSLRIHSLLVVDDKLRSADVDFIAIPPADGPGTIDKELIRYALEQMFGIDASPVLPDRVEYARLGAKFLLSGDQLTVRGTHGANGRTILTIKVAGRELGLIGQPDETFEVGDLMAMVRREVERYDLEFLEEWWTRQHGYEELEADQR
ncbi:MAG: hypothetical protein JSV19_13330 [Phycisphaerales bacterium]|nr:MAG: hypothetical protein JSV19_13330 [Phycisphaerales bacterium]